MDSNSAGSVQYDRWNEDNINMNIEASHSATACLLCLSFSYIYRIYNSVCIGNTGIAVKTAGALAALVSIYIIGYVTGYYIHRC
uniref:Small integral membrane protein 1 n=1 Tax=Mastacembelus armatus TaxID=205130 RepID=A0A3Q3MD69_9TELE